MKTIPNGNFVELNHFCLIFPVIIQEPSSCGWGTCRLSPPATSPVVEKNMWNFVRGLWIHTKKLKSNWCNIATRRAEKHFENGTLVPAPTVDCVYKIQRATAHYTLPLLWFSMDIIRTVLLSVLSPSGFWLDSFKVGEWEYWQLLRRLMYWKCYFEITRDWVGESCLFLA